MTLLLLFASFHASLYSFVDVCHCRGCRQPLVVLLQVLWYLWGFLGSLCPGFWCQWLFVSLSLPPLWCSLWRHSKVVSSFHRCFVSVVFSSVCLTTDISVFRGSLALLFLLPSQGSSSYLGGLYPGFLAFGRRLAMSRWVSSRLMLSLGFFYPRNFAGVFCSFFGLSMPFNMLLTGFLWVCVPVFPLVEPMWPYILNLIALWSREF